MSSKNEVSRRAFIGGAALAGLSAGAAGLLGCSPQPAANEGEPAAVDAALSSTGGARINDEGRYVPAWMDAPEPYENWDEEMEADVVVIGQGVAGVCAARKALEDGASVIAIEQASTPLYRASQFGVINSEFQKQFGLEYSEEEQQKILNELMKCFNNRPDRRIWSRWARESGAIFDWMMSAAPDYIAIDPRKSNKEIGLWFDNQAGTLVDADGNEQIGMTINGYPTNPDCVPDDDYYATWPAACHILPSQDFVMNAVMDRFAADDNITQLFETWGRQIITDDTGRAVGVFAETLDGRILRITAANGVIIACGDYSSNAEMKDYFIPEGFNFGMWGWFQTDAAGEMANQGSGLRMGHWAGGKIDDIPHAFVVHGFSGGLGNDPFLLVNTEGERFMNEGVTGNYMSSALAHVPGNAFWQIFDDNYPDQVGNVSSGHERYWKIVDDMEEQPWGIFVQGVGMRTRAQVEEHCDFICDSLEELAENMGVPAEAFVATIERYNELADAGFDADFGKDARYLNPVKQPPFYASRFSADTELCFVALNGLCSNSEAQVLDEDRKPIPGLYVCGNSQGSRFSADYPVTYMGISHGMAMVYGYIAGMNAAARLS